MLEAKGAVELSLLLNVFYFYSWCWQLKPEPHAKCVHLSLSYTLSP